MLRKISPQLPELLGRIGWLTAGQILQNLDLGSPQTARRLLQQVSQEGHLLRIPVEKTKSAGRPAYAYGLPLPANQRERLSIHDARTIQAALTIEQVLGGQVVTEHGPGCPSSILRISNPESELRPDALWIQQTESGTLILLLELDTGSEPIQASDPTRSSLIRKCTRYGHWTKNAANNAWFDQWSNPCHLQVLWILPNQSRLETFREQLRNDLNLDWLFLLTTYEQVIELEIDSPIFLRSGFKHPGPLSWQNIQNALCHSSENLTNQPNDSE